MGRCKRRGLDAIITKRGQCSTNWRKDTPVKSDGKRGKLKRLLSKPLYTRRKGLVLSPINESACTDPRNMPTAATQRNRMLESKDDEDAPDSSTDDSSKGIFSQLLDETDSGDTSTSSLPSPEVFRREDVHEEMVDLPSELLDLRVKNSTLLDVSHAENINMQQTPNLSSIVEISQMTHAVDKETSQLALPLKWTSSDELFSAYVSAEKTPVSERATVPSVPMKNRPVTVRSRKIKCKKKVTFDDSVIKKMNVEKVETVTCHKVSESTGVKKVDITSSSLGEVSKVINRNTHHSLEQAVFFDFADKKEGEAFFVRLRKKKSEMSNVCLVAGRCATDLFEVEGDMV